MSAKSLVLISAAVLLGIVCYKVVFVPTSLTMASSPNKVFASGSSPVVVKATMINRLGIPVPFRHLAGKFVVDEGADKIDVVKTESDELIFKTKGATGKLVILFYTSAIAFPVEIIVNISGTAIAGLI
jgi:hypothetical protein